MTFDGVLNGRYKVYIDPAYGTDQSIVMGYKGITKWTAEVNAEVKAKLDSLDYEKLNEGEKASYDHFREYIARFEAGGGKDLDLMDAGYFYCPYLPTELEGKPFKVRQSRCGCGEFHGPNERCGPW